LLIALLAALLAGYLLGSLPFGAWVPAAYGVDIRRVGSGNPGATNVKRVLGRGPGNLVFALDFGKGLLAALLGGGLGGEVGIFLGAAGAVLGHVFPLFLGFRGGKGVAVTMGGLLILLPWAVVLGILGWLAGFYATRVVAVGSLVFAGVLFLVALVQWLAGGPVAGWEVLVALAVAVLLTVRHRDNIGRLFRGEESSFRPRGPSASSSSSPSPRPPHDS
jgi:glycerol-3-phosphate acyltransferase PlsY